MKSRRLLLGWQHGGATSAVWKPTHRNFYLWFPNISYDRSVSLARVGCCVDMRNEARASRLSIVKDDDPVAIVPGQGTKTVSRRALDQNRAGNRALACTRWAHNHHA